MAHRQAASKLTASFAESFSREDFSGGFDSPKRFRFPRLPRGQAKFGEFRTRRLVLEAWDKQEREDMRRGERDEMRA